MAEAQQSEAPVTGAAYGRYLLFRVGERIYALPADEVVEVIRPPRIAAVPQSPPSLLGVTNLRGSVIPVVSLRTLLGQKEAGMSAGRAIVLEAQVHNARSPVAITVDGIESFASIDLKQVETRQAILATEPGEILRGAFPSESRWGAAKIIDIQALLDAAFQQKSEKKARPGARGSAARQKDVARPVGQVRAEQETLLPFDVADQEYALSLESVSEVISLPSSIAAIPFAETLVLGVTSFRNSLLPLLSLRGLLGFDMSPGARRRQKVVVTSVRGVAVGLVADAMRSIIRADRHLIESTPALLAARAGGKTRINAIFRGDNGRRLISILSPDTLFRGDVMQRLGSHLASAPQEMAAGGGGEAQSQFIVFHLGDEEFSLPIDAVDEVARVPDQITRIPKTPKFLEGVVNLRGDVLPVIDQRRRFDLPKFAGDPRRRRLLIVRSGQHRAGLIVDSVSGLLRFPASSIDAPPDLADDGTQLILGVINLQASARIVMVLDPGELLTRAERGLLDTFAAASAKANT
jgi:purine-binding chemotaxis protein CheW